MGIMVNRLLARYKKELFAPGLVGMFINPFFFIRRGLFRAIKKYGINMNGRLLDFGCGSMPYKNLFNVQSYFGVDVFNESHSHEKEPVSVFYDGDNLPFKDGTFDSVFSSEVFEHVFELDNILDELGRVLKPNGTALFTVPFVWDEHEIPHDFGRYTSFGIRYLLEKHGFKVVASEKSTKFLETVFQLWNLYIYYRLYTRYKYVNIVINCIFIAPFTVTGILLSKLLPNKETLYNNNVILVTKTS